MGLIDVGNQQTGLNADTSFAALNGTVIVPPGGWLPIGYPLARNLLALQGGLLNKWASIAGLGAFANGDDQVTITNAGSGIAGGVYIGQPQQNPWLNQPAGTLNTAPLNAEGHIARTGSRPVLVGALNGGTSVKVGDFVQKSALSQASTTPFLLSAGPSTVTAGQAYGQVVASPIWTTLTSAIGPGSALVIPVWNTDGIQTTTPLIINPGGSNQETVVPTAITSDAPGIAAFTVAGTAGSASTIQLTFTLAGYQGSTGVAPSGTATTTFSLVIANANGNTATQTATAVLTALQNSGFAFGASQNILGIGSGSFSSTNGAPATGPLIYVSQSAGVLTFSAANPGTWANTLLTYTVTVLNGTTQTFNTNVAGSATPVAFASGAQGTFTATLQNAHVAGEPVIGYNNVYGSVICNVPGTAGMQNTALVYVDLITA